MRRMTDPRQLDLAGLARAYREGTCTPEDATAAYLDVIEAGPVYRLVTAARARRQARRATELFEGGIDLGPLQGIPIALKDLIDTEGDVTAAGSPALAARTPAVEDAPIAARLDAAGAVFLGKTNMTELAFSGIGINPHFGTPGCAADASRIPGGSSSGSAVAVATGLACAAVGSDTGGSVRIPSSFNGLVGLKPTDGALPSDGMQPLSTTLDTAGPIVRTASDAWDLFLAMAARPQRALPELPPRLRLLAPETVVLDGLDPEVTQAYQAALNALEGAGHDIVRRPLPALARVGELYAALGTFAAHEAYALYEETIATHGDMMDPRVTARILQVAERPARDYIRLGYARRQLQRSTWEEVRRFHAVLAPTVAILPPRIDALANDADYFAVNAMCLRNTMLFNFLGGPAVTVPAGVGAGGLPIGLMIAAAPQQDAAALAIAHAFERVLNA